MEYLRLQREIKRQLHQVQYRRMEAHVEGGDALREPRHVEDCWGSVARGGGGLLRLARLVQTLALALHLRRVHTQVHQLYTSENTNVDQKVAYARIRNSVTQDFAITNCVRSSTFWHRLKRATSRPN